MNKYLKEQKIVYFSLAMMGALVGAVFYTMLKIIPVYKKTYSLFFPQLPKITKLCFKLSSAIDNNFATLLIITCIAMVCCFIMAVKVKKRVLLAEFFTFMATLAFCVITVSYCAVKTPVIKAAKTMNFIGENKTGTNSN